MNVTRTLSILHITPYYAPAWAYGGVVRAVYGLATAQAALGHHVTVLTTDTLSPGARINALHQTQDSISIIRCRNRFKALRRINLSTPSGWRYALDNLLESPNAPDVVHCHELRTTENLLSIPIAAAHGKPVVVSPHGTLPRETGRSLIKHVWDLMFGRRLARYVDGVLTLTSAEAEAARDWLEAMGAAPPITVIPNGVDIPATSALHLEGPPVGPTVLFVGRLHKRKGIQFLIPAFAQAVATGGLSDARLLIVGPDEGVLAHARQMALEAGLGDRVIFTGLLTGTARDEAVAKADLFVLPAVGEGLSIAALEAMAAGLPVILTPGCNLPEVQPRGAGLIVSREIPALARAIRELLLDPARRAAMGAAGRQWMAESFAWPTVAQRTVAFYHEIVGKHR